MTRREFLNELYRRLGKMSREEAEQYLTYYAEMLADRMEEGMTEEEAVASMEDVETIAARIRQERAEEGNANAKESAPRPLTRTRIIAPGGGQGSLPAEEEEPEPPGRRPGGCCPWPWRRCCWSASFFCQVPAGRGRLHQWGRHLHRRPCHHQP